MGGKGKVNPGALIISRAVRERSWQLDCASGKVRLACPSASAVLAEAGARVLWPVHSRGCPVCATLGS